MVGSLVLLCSLLVSGRRSRLDARLRELSGQANPALDQETIAKVALTTLPKMGAPLIPSDEEERTRLQTRLIRAGMYSRQAMVVFLGAKVLLMVAPVCIGFIAGVLGLVKVNNGVILGGCLSIVGTIGPSFWLDQQRRNRQANFRRALPDALDVLVICLEGGLSLPSALKRVSSELRSAHPTLAIELNVVQREIQLGQSPGEALRKMGERCDLEEVRSLAAVILQAERFGASLVKSLRVHSDSLRHKRQQRAEELAQLAATKILIPTVLFILPAIFVVILAPAAIHAIRMFTQMKV
jgi:tight adherence protein C